MLGQAGPDRASARDATGRRAHIGGVGDSTRVSLPRRGYIIGVDDSRQLAREETLEHRLA